MHNYTNFTTEEIIDFSDENIEQMYDNGYVMTRIDKGMMNETISLRIDLKHFELTSENRRILRKNEDITLQIEDLPIEHQNYDWRVHKMGKDFYTDKFGDKTFSASKIKQLLTQDHNFSSLFKYFHINLSDPIGYCICVKTGKILHYCYPFYDLEFAQENKNIGMGMMLKAVLYAKENGYNYVYLGSLTRPGDKYKLQFKGLQKWIHETQNWENIAI